jgi:ketosteroid isomerase-like protein
MPMTRAFTLLQRLARSSSRVAGNYRVAMVFRREDAQWRIVHRHADTQTSREAPR